MPTFRPPVTEGPSRGDIESFDPAERLFGHYKGHDEGNTVWKDESGVWRTGTYPVQGGLTSRSFTDGVLTGETSIPGLETAQEVYHGGHQYEVSHAKADELLALGFHVGGRNEEEQQRYIDYCISSTPNFDYKGGDACASALLGSGDTFVVFADTVIGTVGADGRYQTFFVVSNSAWTQNPAGDITFQFHPGGSQQAFPHPTPPKFFWPLDTWNEPSESAQPLVLCAEGQPSGGVFPEIINTVILELNFLGGISVIHTSPHYAYFRPQCAMRGDTHTYMIGEQNKLARVVNEDILNFAAWEFWNGTTWSTDPTNIASITKTDGTAFTGWCDLRMVGDKFVIVEMQLYKEGVFLYSADSPELPWQHYYTEPVRSRINGELLDRRQFWFYYAPHFHEHRDPSANTMFVSYNRNVFPHNPSKTVSAIGQHVDKHIPQFLWMPTP